MTTVVFVQRKGAVMRLVAGLLLAALTGGVADAADYDPPVLRGSQVLQVGSPAVPQWSGFYIGGQGAFGTTSTDFANATAPLVAFLLRNTTIENENHVSEWTTLGKASSSAIGYGGFMGYNWQWADAVLGVDATWVHGSLRTSSTETIRRLFSTTDGYNNDVRVDASASMTVKDYGSIRGRAGYAFGNILPYATIGVALGRGDLVRSATVTASGTSTTGGPAYGPTTLTRSETEASKIMYGWALGAGFDLQVIDNFFVRGEWEYLRYTVPIDTYISVARAGAGIRF